ncbi:HPr family phosphocarrier protein [Paenarthrobacter sp. C1]|uniref:HPr family phosphocarrier protein n=1 Tax=Paenarthrobacter sp. C1 TaxID=3400220 RepID=UPI003BF5FACB
MNERVANIASRVGLHARPAAIFAEAVAGLENDVTIARQGEPEEFAVDASSILSLMGLGISHGEVVVLRSEGAVESLDHLVDILETDLDIETPS